MSEVEVDKKQVDDGGACDHVETPGKQQPTIAQKHAEIYREALERYPNDEAIGTEEEKRVVRKIDARIIAALGICYFFYVMPTFCRRRRPFIEISAA